MTELERERRARDLWISRGHVRAALTGMAVLVATAFIVGFVVGRDTVPEIPRDESSLQSADTLVDLLARVEASAQPNGGVEELTFPDALIGRDVSGQSNGPGEMVTPIGDVPPVGVFTLVAKEESTAEAAIALRDTLKKSDLDAWVWHERVEGRPVWRVAIGGYPSEESAEKARTEAIVPSDIHLEIVKRLP